MTHAASIAFVAGIVSSAICTSAVCQLCHSARGQHAHVFGLQCSTILFWLWIAAGSAALHDERRTAVIASYTWQAKPCAETVWLSNGCR